MWRQASRLDQPDIANIAEYSVFMLATLLSLPTIFRHILFDSPRRLS
jgi:hypothetical protein